MASRGLGTLTLDLIAKIGGFEQGMDKAARHADKRMREIERRAQGFGNALGRSLKSAAGGLLAFVGVTASVAAGVDAIKSAIDRADNIRDLSIRLGIGTETLSAFGYAATQTGTDIEALNKGLLRLSKNATAALDPKSRQSNLFKALGISTDQLKDLDTLVPAIADKFAGMADGVQKAALAQELFGKSGAQLIEFLNQGAAGLQTMADRAAELGIVIDQETADAADRFNDKLGDLRAAIGGLSMQVAEALLPKLEELLDWAQAFVTDGDNAKQVADSIATAFDGMVTAGKAIGSVITVLEGVRNVLAGLEKEAVAAGEVMRSALTFDLAGLKKAIQDYKTGAAQIQAGFDGKEFNDPRKPQRRTTPIPDLQVPFLQPLFPQFSAVPLPTPTRPQGVDQSALDAYYRTGGRTPSSGGGGRKAKKDTSLEDAARDAEKAREELKRLVEQEDQARDAFESMAASLAGPLADANFQFIKDQERLNELAREGAIGAEDLAAAQENLRTAHEKNVAALQAQLTPSQEVIAGLREEIELIGMSDIAQQKLIATRQAGSEATAAEVAEIERLIEVRDQAMKAADLQREIEVGLADAMFDAATGAKEAGDAVKDFFDDLAKYILRMIFEGWAKKIAGLFDGSASTGGGGGGGTNWIGLIAGLFGGGKASGGTAQAGTMYRVNENGTEMLSIGGKDYLMMGSQPGRITPNHQLPTGGGYNQVNNFNFAAPTSESTQKQVAARVGYESRLQMSRN